MISAHIADEQFTESLHKAHKHLKNHIDVDEFVDFSCLSIENLDLTPAEIVSVNKSMIYIVQRLSLIIISPTKLQNDLKTIGFSNEKSDLLLAFYSRISCDFIKDMQMTEDMSVKWNEHSTTSDDVCQMKCRKSKANITIQQGFNQILLQEMNLRTLSTLYNSFETIQRELDVLTGK